MSLSHFRHPFDRVPRPALEPEVMHAMLASWASDPDAARGGAEFRTVAKAASAGSVGKVRSAPRSLHR